MGDKMKLSKFLISLLVIAGGVFVAIIKKREIRKYRTSITMEDGSIINISHKRRPSIRDMRDDVAIKKAVSDAIADKFKKGLPIARYDLARKQPYWEYPDGRVEYVK